MGVYRRLRCYRCAKSFGIPACICGIDVCDISPATSHIPV